MAVTDEAVLTWYTYDSEGNQLWMIGTGQYEEGRIVFPQLHSSRGARFGEAFDPEDVERFGWGTLTMDLKCTSGNAQYDSQLAGFGAGEFDLNRLTRLKRPDCPYVQPKLQDLYEITWNEVPIAPDASIRAESIANDGTIAAAKGLSIPQGGFNLALWRPQLREWEIVSGRRIQRVPIMISWDAGTVSASDEVKDLGEPIFPLRWTSELGWRPLPNRVFDTSWTTAASHDFSHFAGRGRRNFGDTQSPWIWNNSHGQRELSTSDEHPSPMPRMVANDGEIVVGISFQYTGGFSKRVAIMWKGDQEPQTIRDRFGTSLAFATRCDRDCSIVFGSGQAEFDPEHPHAGEAWLKIGNRDVQYLGRLPDTDILRHISYAVTGSTSDGSMATGTYDANGTDTRAFIWTQRTGLVSVRTLVEELGIGDDEWTKMGAGVSPNGRRVLLAGLGPASGPGEGPTPRRAVVLHLKPREGLE